MKAPANFKTQLSWVIKYSRAYFPDEATREMLDEWMPMLCPVDRTMSLALKYMGLFLPTNRELPPEKGYKLWFHELMAYWETFSNFPSWEVDLFRVRVIFKTPFSPLPPQERKTPPFCRSLNRVFSCFLLKLYSRLTFHNVGVIDWEPYLEPIFARFVAQTQR